LAELPPMTYLKIGELAKEVGCLPSTIHFYTQEGLLQEVKRSRGGYRLYDPVEAPKRLRQIFNLQEKKRWRIEEIKKLFK